MYSKYRTLVFSVVAALLVCLIQNASLVKSEIIVNNKLTPAPQIGLSQTESYTFANKTIKLNKKLQRLTGNQLWDGLINDCLDKPTFSCIQKNVYTYLDDTLNLSDVNVTDRFVFKQNKIDYTKYTKEANELHDADGDKINEIDDTYQEEGRSDLVDSPLEEVTNSLYGKGVKFMMTHDIEMKLPEMMFDGATFRIQPRSIEGNGALVKIEFLPKGITDVARDTGTGRIFLKKIKKFFKNKLLLAFLAIVLIIKIIKIKLFWLLPLIVGVAAAKKLVLKVVLFLFPALSQIFKLCSWYHHNYHQTKHHFHSHHINHLHTVVPSIDDFHHTSPPYGSDIIYSQPPKGHPSEYIHGGPPPPQGSLHTHEHNQWEFSGPGLGSEYIGDVHRNAQVQRNPNFKPKLDDINEISSWGLGSTGAPMPSNSNINNNNNFNYNANPFGDNNNNRNHKAQANSINPVYVSPKNRQQQVGQIGQQFNPSQALDLRTQEAIRLQQEQKLIAAQQQRILNDQQFNSIGVDNSHNLVQSTIMIDPFYSPILAKIDKVYVSLGLGENEEGCRERLVCSMYKNPTRYSPHSNYISAELSRDSTELQKPQQTNAAVIRFYRYIQAARDGQDQQDCLRIYQQCSIATEK